MNNYRFGNYICELREKKGLSQSELGERLGVSNKAVSKWENGGAYPSSELMLPLARALGVSIEELYSALSNSKMKKTWVKRMLAALAEKSRFFLVGGLLFFAVLWGLFLIFGDMPDKVMLLILAPCAAIAVYGMFRLVFYIGKRSALLPAWYEDVLSVFLLFATLLATVTALFEFIGGFPNGFTPVAGIGVAILLGLLHANKK